MGRPLERRLISFQPGAAVRPDMRPRSRGPTPMLCHACRGRHPRHSRTPRAGLDRNGLMAWSEALQRGYEGIVAKDPESRDVPGRTLKWLKVKQKDYRKEERGFYRE